MFDGDRWFLLWRQDVPAHETGTIVAAPLRDDGTVHAVLHAYRDGGTHPDAPRAGWALRVEPDPDSSSPTGYHLVEVS